MKTRILLVEDDERLAELTAEYLRKNDFEVLIEPHVATRPKRASSPSDPTW
jgi:two-component system OmpR family response regulator